MEVDTENCREWMPWYPEKYQNGEHTSLMSFEEDLVYRRLLDAMWKTQSPVGTMPMDDRQIAQLAKVPATLWRKVRDQVLKCFVAGDDGRWHQPDQKIIWEKQTKSYLARVSASRKGGEAKAAKGNPTGLLSAMPNHVPKHTRHHSRSREESLSTKTPPPALGGAVGVEENSPPPKLILMAEALARHTIPQPEAVDARIP